jgi:hypothetical protein
LIIALEIPSTARSVSFGIDRVSLPMEEPRPRPVGRPRKDAPTRPVQRVYRMAYCTTVTFHDETGRALHTIRQGAVPSVDPVDLCDRLLADAVAILEQRPDLTVVLLSDGAPKMRTLLRSALDESTLGTTVYELLDFWHLLEKLGAAAQVLSGEADAPDVIARWRVDLLNRNAAPDDILRALTQSGRRYVRVGQDQPVHEAITYLLSRKPSRVARVSRGSPTGPADREWEYRGHVQDLVHRPHEAEWRPLERSHGRRRHQSAGAGTQRSLDSGPSAYARATSKGRASRCLITMRVTPVETRSFAAIGMT